MKHLILISLLTLISCREECNCRGDISSSYIVESYYYQGVYIHQCVIYHNPPIALCVDGEINEVCSEITEVIAENRYTTFHELIDSAIGYRVISVEKAVCK